MTRTKIAEVIFEKLALGSVAAVIVLLFGYFIDVQKQINKTVIDNQVTAGNFSKAIDDVRSNIISELSSLLVQLSDYGISEEITKDSIIKGLSKFKETIDSQRAIIEGMKAEFSEILPDRAELVYGKFGVDTIELLANLEQNISGVRLSESNTFEFGKKVRNFHTYLNVTMPKLYRSVSTDLVLASRIGIYIATDAVETSVRSSAGAMLWPVVALIVIAILMALGVLLWARQKSDNGGEYTGENLQRLTKTTADPPRQSEPGTKPEPSERLQIEPDSSSVRSSRGSDVAERPAAGV